VLEPRIIQGRTIGNSQIEQIRELIEANPRWSRWRLSRALAQKWAWYSSSGELKDMAARTLLLKLQQRELIRLPERRRRPARRGPHFSEDLFDTLSPQPIEAQLTALQPLRIEVVRPKHPDFHAFQRYLLRHHYLSYGGPVGQNIGYLVQSHSGQDLACLLFGAAAWKAAARDQWIGWSADQRARGLPFIANNSRFLVLPWVRVGSLASHILACVSSRINADWQARYGHDIYLLESFVEQGPFQGTCYKAANWIHLGQTTGRTRQDRYNTIRTPCKDLYIYPLDPHAQQRLSSAFLG
jgi:Druantia protein DruA